ncbi:MAG: ABC transporter ATP-binding protein [Pseudomonadota bacterium]
MDHPPVPILEEVSMTIGAGEILGIVGESGAGKSMTGAAVTGLLEPPLAKTGGAIHFKGARIDTLPEAQLRRLRGRAIGTIFQDPLTALNPVFTIGRQLVETIRTHAGLSEAAARQKAIALLEAVGIPGASERLWHYPHAFSGGMRQRVVIALALAGDPDLLIADEPTTALDVSIQAQIIELLLSLSRKIGAGVMLITHDMGVIAQAADKVAVMYAGRVVEMGPVRQVLTAPRHPYTAGLVASIPEIGAGLETLPQIGGAMPRAGERPGGCAFHPRCPRKLNVCESIQPQAGTTASGVVVACHAEMAA